MSSLTCNKYFEFLAIKEKKTENWVKQKYEISNQNSARKIYLQINFKIRYSFTKEKENDTNW